MPKKRIKTKNQISTKTKVVVVGALLASVSLAAAGFYMSATKGRTPTLKTTLTYVVDETDSTAGGADSSPDGSCQSEEAGGGTCSLREAVEAANSSGFTASRVNIILPSATLTLQRAVVNPEMPTLVVGDIDVTTRTPIYMYGKCGGGSAYSIVDASRLGARIFDLSSGTSLNISCVSFNGGTDDFGGAIRNIDGTLRLDSCFFEGNVASREGGAVYNYSPNSFEVVNSSFLDNYASYYGGAISVYHSTANISNSVFRGNSLDESNGEFGGAIHLSSYSSVNISDSSFVLNVADNGGGAIGSFSTASFNISDSEFIENRARDGGGVYASGDLNVINSLFSQNEANSSTGLDSVAGGLSLWGNTNISNSDISNNVSTGPAGGILVGTSGSLTISNSLVSSNSATDGGGIFAQAPLTVTNCTLDNNQVSDSSSYSAIDFSSSFGFIKIASSTVGNNSGGYGALSHAQIKGSLLYNNSNYLGTTVNCFGGVESFGYNIDADFTGLPNCGFSEVGDLGGVDPLFSTGLLSDNGGDTQTVALSPSSPAIDAISLLACTDFDGNLIATDQREVSRANGSTTGSMCDIGAFEYEN